MSKKKHDEESSFQVGNISRISGNVNIAGGDITTHQTTRGISVEEIRQLFEHIYSAIETNTRTSPADKQDLKAEVKEIQSTVAKATEKNEKIEEGFLSRRFRNIARVAPDMLDVVVATLGNPLAGLGVTVKKIAEKAKEDTESSIK